MAVYVREASLSYDRGTLVGLTRAHLFAGTTERRFQWLYQENPFGSARAWLAIDGNTQQAIGMASLFPRRGLINGARATCCVLGDFCVSEKYRTLGPALQLQRACLSAVKAGPFALCYDYPNPAMLAVYKHLGVVPNCKLVRMVKRLRTEDKMKQWISSERVSRAAARIADLALLLREGYISDPAGVQFRLEEQECTAEYSRLADRIGSSLGGCTLRTSAYLNWRYRRNPITAYEFLAAYRGEELLAYCVFSIADRQAWVAELFGRSDNSIVTGLFRRLAALLRSRGAVSINVVLLASDVRMGALRKAGFWQRESTPVIACDSDLKNFGSWLLLMQGDRES